MHTIAIVNEKGGTGKTTTAVNLAAALGEMQHKVLLVDLDGQAASSRWLGVEEDTSFADALYAGKGIKPIPEVIANVSLAPASGKLDAVAHDLRPTQGGQLRRLLSEVSSQFEFVVIDCPPSLGNRLIGNALIASSHAIVPVETSVLAMDGLKILLTTLEDVREGFGHNIILAGVLACRFDSRTKLSRLILAELQRALPGRVFQTVIRENVRMRECPASGQSIITYAPDSHAADDYRSLARELLASPWLTAVPQDEADASGTAAFFAAEKDQHLGDSLRQSVRRSQVSGDEDASTWKKRLEEAQERLSAEGVQVEEGAVVRGAEGEATTTSTNPAASVSVEQAPVEQGAVVCEVQRSNHVQGTSESSTDNKNAAPAEQPPVADAIPDSPKEFVMPPIAEVPQAQQTFEMPPAPAAEPAPVAEPAQVIEPAPAAGPEPADSSIAPAGNAPEAPPPSEPAVWIDPAVAAPAAPPTPAAVPQAPVTHEVQIGWSGTKIELEKKRTARAPEKTGWEHAVTSAEPNGNSGIMPALNPEPAWSQPASNAAVSGDASWLELITGGSQTPSPTPEAQAAPDAKPAPQTANPPAPEGHPEEYGWDVGASEEKIAASPDCPHLRKYLASLQSGQGASQEASDDSSQAHDQKRKGLFGRIFARSR